MGEESRMYAFCAELKTTSAAGAIEHLHSRIYRVWIFIKLQAEWNIGVSAAESQWGIEHLWWNVWILEYDL